MNAATPVIGKARRKLDLSNAKFRTLVLDECGSIVKHGRRYREATAEDMAAFREWMAEIAEELSILAATRRHEASQAALREQEKPG